MTEIRKTPTLFGYRAADWRTSASRMALEQELQERREEVAGLLGCVFDKKQGHFDGASSSITIDSTIERWGNYWARFLWQLRKSLGAPIADILIAHSLFFLTRWSDFRMGVASHALLMADRLLFGGNHRDTLAELSGIDKRWRRLSGPEAIDDLDYSRWIHIEMS